MKPLQQCSDGELVRLAHEAEALPDAPAAWIARANALMAGPESVGFGDVLQAGWRLVRAVLRFDSAAPQPGAPVLAMRSGQSGAVRQLLFSAEGRDVDVRVVQGGTGFDLSGQVLGPDEGGEVELRQLGGNAAALSVPVDALGEFRFEGLHGGPCQLTLRLGGDAVELPPFDLRQSDG